MGFLRDMFRTAGEVAQLTARCAWLDAEREKLEWKVQALEKEVRSERRRFDTLQRTYLNQISVKNGLYGAFKEPESPPQSPPVAAPVLTLVESTTLEDYARQLRDEDRARGIERPLEAYLEAMRKNPELYLDAA